MPHPLANGWQPAPAIDQFSRMRMPKLVQRAGDACLRAVVVPSFLHRLVTQWSSSSVLFRSEQGPVLVAPAFEVGSELLHQTWIVEQDRSPLAAFPHDGQMLIIEREVKILHIQGKPLADSQAGLREQTEEEPVTQTLGGNSFENALNLGTLHSTRLWRVEVYPGRPSHRVWGGPVLVSGPRPKTGGRRP